MSQYQLPPYNRVQELFTQKMGIPLSGGSVYNFNVEAFKKAKPFEDIAKQRLTDAALLHADETGINVNGDRHWLHCATNASWTYFFAYKKRGNEATNSVEILSAFKGVLCHDHWKLYYCYTDCLHALCNAHHLRELTRAWEQDGQEWAEHLKLFLKETNRAVHTSGENLDHEGSVACWQRYRELLRNTEVECPPPDEKDRRGKRGRIKRSKARNILERLINFEEDALRFMDNSIVHFTNNQGE